MIAAKIANVLRSGALALALFLTLTVSLAMAGSPMEDIKSLMDEVMAVINNPEYQSPAQKQARVQLIEKLATRKLDYQEMAQRCLGNTWNTLTSAQKSEFIHLFSELLKASYADRLDELTKTQVSYQKETRNGDQAEVAVLILRPNDKIPVTFKMSQDSRGWMINDLIVEDVSLMSNFNSQFSRVIKGAGYGELVACLKLQLKAKSVDLKACPTPPDATKKPKSKTKG
jgi:phospholipid transport system substrate-binding protein